MLRGINVGGHNLIKMDALRELYNSLRFQDAQTYVQSGNVIFRTKITDETALAKKIQAAVEKAFGVRPEIILRTKSQMGDVIAANPFAKRKDVPPNKLLVSFLASEPMAETRKKIESVIASPEEMRLVGRELYVYFPDGAGRSKLVPVLDRIFKTSATARNWNSVTKMFEIASRLED